MAEMFIYPPNTDSEPYEPLSDADMQALREEMRKDRLSDVPELPEALKKYLKCKDVVYLRRNIPFQKFLLEVVEGESEFLNMKRCEVIELVLKMMKEGKSKPLKGIKTEEIELLYNCMCD